jgi:hypothetical protein
MHWRKCAKCPANGVRLGFGCALITIVANRKENTAGSELSMDHTDHDNVNEATTTHRVIALFAGYVAEVEYDATLKQGAALTAQGF